MLKVTCESPEPLPFAPVRLVDGDREWNQRLGDTANPVSYPASTPLSPLYRQHAFFHVTEEVVTGEGSRWVVPREALSRARIEITPLHPAGSTVVSYELRECRSLCVRSRGIVEPDCNPPTFQRDCPRFDGGRNRHRCVGRASRRIH